jgi:hypothetical protein
LIEYRDTRRRARPRGEAALALNEHHDRDDRADDEGDDRDEADDLRPAPRALAGHFP